MPGIRFRFVLPAVLLAGFASCSKETSVAPTQPGGATAVLYAVPPKVSVGIGGVQHVNVFGGTPPYVITSGPAAIATVEISDADSSTAILKIMGVTAASDTTAVTVRDNTRPVPKTVTVPVSVF